MDVTFAAYEHCELCPRRCGVDRAHGKTGVCGQTAELVVARSALHFWEEPPISGDVGSGAIFFSGCPLRCVFCQNHEISHEGGGVPVSERRLAQMMLELEEAGAANINLVTPSHFTPHVLAAARLAREAGLAIPFVCNTSGYERTEVVQALAEVVDVWLTDFKYADPALARRLSGAADYPEVAAAALAEMLSSVRARGGRATDAAGYMTRGIICRHLVLPGEVADSLAVVERVFELCGDEVDLSVMSQYTPNERVRQAGGALAHACDMLDADLVVCHADELGFTNLWWQEEGTVSESFVPAFDATGVVGPELA